MICPYCGTKNNRHANVCKKCGKSLNPIATMKKEHLNAHNPYKDEEIETQSDGKGLIIVFLAVIFCIVIILSSVFFIAQDIQSKQTFANSSPNKTSNFTNDPIKQSIPYTDDNENETTVIHNLEDENGNNSEEIGDEYDTVKIISGSFDNGNKLPTKPICTINVGEEYAGEKFKIQVAYSCDSDPLNDGRIIQKTVNSNGEISLKSTKSFKEYPDLAIITLYDREDNILDNIEVSLSANKGIQTF